MVTIRWYQTVPTWSRRDGTNRSLYDEGTGHSSLPGNGPVHGWLTPGPSGKKRHRPFRDLTSRVALSMGFSMSERLSAVEQGSLKVLKSSACASDRVTDRDRRAVPFKVNTCAGISVLPKHRDIEPPVFPTISRFPSSALEISPRSQRMTDRGWQSTTRNEISKDVPRLYPVKSAQPFRVLAANRTTNDVRR
jgi:hypothetical protein